MITQPIAYNWWLQEPDRAATTIFQLIKHWDLTQGSIQAANLRNMKLYSNKEVSSLSIAQYVLSSSQDYLNGGAFGGGQSNRTNKISLNIVKSCVDTLHSKIGKNKIKPTFITTGGSIKHKQKAQKLNNFLFGCFFEGNVYTIAPIVLRDACIFGTGVIKAYLGKDKRIKYERVFPDEITCDPADGYYGNPRTMYQRKFISREYLIEMFPEKQAQLMTVKQTDCANTGAAQDTILVVEAWHLGPQGKHCIVVNGHSLFEEEWTREDFPFVFIRYTDPLLGFFGTGVTDELLGIQIEINRLLMHIQESMRLISHPRIFIETASKVNPKHFTNEIGSFVPYSGNPPIVQAAQSVHPELFQHLENLWNKGYQAVGVSALSATSQKPAGLNSGAALSEYNDIETERFARFAQAYEQMFVDLAHKTCYELDSHPSYRINAPEKDAGLEKLYYKDIKLPKDEYTIQCFPTSALPKSPPARLQHVKDMMELGIVDGLQAAELLDFPDLEAYNRITLSPIRLAYKIIEGILFDGKEVEPEPFMDLHLTQTIAQKYYCWALTLDEESVDENNLDMLRNFMQSIEAMKAQATIEAQENMPPSPQEMGLGAIQPPMPTQMAS